MRFASTVLPCVAYLALSASVVVASNNWYVGETVVCVNNRFLDLSDAPELVEGKAYTITDIWPARRGHLGLQIAGINAKPYFRAFDERRFMPALNAAADCSTCRRQTASSN